MILYNVTINVEQTIEEEWLHWMKTEHVLDVLNTGMFKDAKVLRLLNVEQSEGTATYAIQYFAESMQHYERYQGEFALDLQKEHLQRFGSQTVSFRTVMEEV